MFNENTAMQDQPQGHDETGATATRPMVGSNEAASSPTPSTPPGTIALAWWDAMKYFWRKSASGGYHLAPQDDFVSDVLDRSKVYTAKTHDEYSEDDFKALDAELELIQQRIQSRNARNTSGIEGQRILRDELNRTVIALKIAGASAVSAEHRTINELGKPDGNVEAMQSDTNGYYQADLEKRQRWAEVAVDQYYFITNLADGDVIPKDQAALDELLAKRIRNSLYDDAVERGNRLKRPAPGTQQSGNKPSREELLAMTA